MTIERETHRQEERMGNRRYFGLNKDKRLKNGTMNYKFKAVMSPPPQTKMQSTPVDQSTLSLDPAFNDKF